MSQTKLYRNSQIENELNNHPDLKELGFITSNISSILGTSKAAVEVIKALAGNKDNLIALKKEGFTSANISSILGGAGAKAVELINRLLEAKKDQNFWNDISNILKDPKEQVWDDISNNSLKAKGERKKWKDIIKRKRTEGDQSNYNHINTSVSSSSGNLDNVSQSALPTLFDDSISEYGKNQVPAITALPGSPVSRQTSNSSLSSLFSFVETLDPEGTESPRKTSRLQTGGSQSPSSKPSPSSNKRNIDDLSLTLKHPKKIKPSQEDPGSFASSVLSGRRKQEEKSSGMA